MPCDEGEKAPDFSVPASNGKNVSLKDYKGTQSVVLYFYPKDDTPGCTTEACGFRKAFKLIEKEGAVVLGVSPDPVGAHEKFIEKYNLPFVLLSDEDHRLCESYGVWVEKSMYGRKYMGVERTTFVIDTSGTIVKKFSKVKPEGHEAEVVLALRKLKEI